MLRSHFDDRAVTAMQTKIAFRSTALLLHKGLRDLEGEGGLAS